MTTSDQYYEAIASSYDELYEVRTSLPDTVATVEVLQDLAGQGPVLELGVGTGRAALPLAERGLEVHGIDSSQAMLSVLTSKMSARFPMQAVLGDFSAFSFSRRFSLIYALFNSIWCLATPELQQACVRCSATHLQAGALFLVEAYVPDPGRFVDGQSLRTTFLGPTRLHLEVSKHDAANQRVESRHVFLSMGAIQVLPRLVRYLHPEELDAMAAAAGLRLRERWGSWARTEFTSSSTTHISIYEKEPAGSS
jgi:SAM-dependent methyltransferase